VGFYLDGRPYAELAEQLGVPVSAVRGRLFHARRHLRRSLAPLAPPGPSRVGVGIMVTHNPLHRVG
jgi:hypothetical protein